MGRTARVWEVAVFCSGRMRAMLVELTSDELRIINNALNEVCNGIDLRGEFSTRMGCSLEEAQMLLTKINTLAS